MSTASVAFKWSVYRPWFALRISEQY